MTQMNLKKQFGDPTEFWDYFENISRIPRCSGEEKEIREFISKEAQRFGYLVKTDDIGNLLVKIPRNTNEQAPTSLTLQCHMDMVCEKNQGVQHDFMKDPIQLKVVEIENEPWLTAEGTTLGADNGVGISYCLALMKQLHEGQLEYGNVRLELLFTVDEESGLIGAFKIGEGMLNTNYLINLDSEDEDAFTIGCAGGITTTGDMPYTPESNQELLKTHRALSIKVKGLIGGHSGADIHKGRANAIKIIAKISWKLNNRFSLHLLEINGGNRGNAIPRECEAIALIQEKDIDEAKQLVKQVISEIELGISSKEPGMEISVSELDDSIRDEIIPKDISDKLLHLLYVMPNGPISWHPTIQDLVYTSTNLAAVTTEEGNIRVLTTQRSLHEISKTIVSEQMVALFQLADAGIKINHTGDYPGWEPKFNSSLLKLVKKAYQELHDKEPNIRAIHAGLECGILKDKFPETEMISIGPTCKGFHSPDERLKVPSVNKVWQLLLKVLDNLNQPP